MPVEPEDHELYEEFLALNRGSKVRIRVPQRGGKRELLADRDAQRARVVRSGTSCGARPITTRAPARSLALQEALDLPEAPLRIECFDISQPPGHRDRRRRWS